MKSKDCSVKDTNNTMLDKQIAQSCILSEIHFS